jgi:hypothetical protein
MLLVRPPGKNGQKPLTQTSPMNNGMLKDAEKDGKLKNTSALREQFLRPNPCLCSQRRSNLKLLLVFLKSDT